MEELKLGTVESKFADIIWENEPISSGQLVNYAGSSWTGRSLPHIPG